MNEELTRRKFLQTATGAAALSLSAGTGIAATLVAPTKETRRRMTTSANDKVRMGFIGVAGRGYGALMHGFGALPDVEIVAVCDVYQPHLDRAVAFTNGKAKAYKDFRKLLADKNVDAVAVATPPHWHTLITLAALEAGKDVYCEKPMSRFPMEAKLMTDYAKKYNRITQVGTQIHSTENYHTCVDIVRSGLLGPITSVTNFCTMNDDSEGLGTPPDETPPADLDWNFWLGPAPEVPFNTGRFRDGMHRYFKDYVDSWLHELGPHIIDLPFWALELPIPQATSASGGRFATTSMADVPDTLHVLWQYANMTVTWEMMQANSFHFGVGNPGPGRHNGIVFHGKDLTLSIVNYGTPVVTDKAGKVITDLQYPKVTTPSPGQEAEFIAGVKSRQECPCSFANHLPMHMAMHLAHLSLKVGRTLHFDETKWEIPGDREATKMMTPTYRRPWKLPKA